MKSGYACALFSAVYSSEQVSIEYCLNTGEQAQRCYMRGNFDLSTSTFEVDKTFNLSILKDAATVTVRGGGAQAIAENLGLREELNLWLTSSGEVSGLSLHLLPAEGASSKFQVVKPQTVTAPIVQISKKEEKTSEPPGKEEEQQEPSFLKKYWWAILLIYAGAQVVAATAENQTDSVDKKTN